MFASSRKSFRPFFKSVYYASANKLKLLIYLNIHIFFMISILLLFPKMNTDYIWVRSILITHSIHFTFLQFIGFAYVYALYNRKMLSYGWHLLKKYYEPIFRAILYYVFDRTPSKVAGDG